MFNVSCECFVILANVREQELCRRSIKTVRGARRSTQPRNIA